MSSPTGGLGQPGPGQPDFDGPQQAAPGTSGWAPGSSGWAPGSSGWDPAGTQQPSTPQPQPQQGQQYPQTQQYPQGQQNTPVQQYAPSQPYPHGQQYPQGQQGGYQPPVQPTRRPSGSGGRGLILAGVVIVSLIVGLLGWQLLGPGAASQEPTPSASPIPSAPASARGTPQPSVTRVTESPQPTTSTAVSGGGIGQSVGFRTRTGSGAVTVTKATWADNGMIDPTDGQQYLIVDVALRGVSGQITTGPFFASVVDSQGDTHMLTIGAALDNQLAMRTLGPGEQNTGQIAFELEKGAVTFQLLDELLQPVATVEIPG